MASTGIILRRKLGKNLFTGEETPIPGELVMDLNTTNFGFLDEDGVTIKWGKLEDEIPTGGIAGQVLTKNTNIDGDVIWSDPVSGTPGGGTGGGEGLVKVDEGNGEGYYLAGDDRSNKGPIGNHAIDLSIYEEEQGGF